MKYKLYTQPKKRRAFWRRTSLSLVALVQLMTVPGFVLAQEATTSTEPETQTTAAETTTTGPTKPTGADSSKYTYNETTKQWENDYYSWNPDTKQTSPKTSQDYSYNPTTGAWDTTQYVYRPESGTYEPNVVSAPTNPNATISSTGPDSTNTIDGANGTIDTTGPNSTNSISGTNTTNGSFDLFFNSTISNNISSSASSGSVGVQGNTSAGSALSGDANSIANIINLLQSSWLDPNAIDMASFIANIDGNVYGDLFIDPDSLPVGSGNTDVDLNVESNAAIDNDINVAANTGNANVSGNTLAGNATSGNASAVVNLVNMLNSSINSGQSFLGVLNIYGNLNGDILLPQHILDGLIAQTGPNSNNQINGNNETNLDVSVDTNRTILNDVDANAASGTSLVSNNTTAGTAKTGQATSQINTMNLVGNNYTGKNGLLVFFNVLGKWIGMSITPSAPSIVNTGPNSTNTIGNNTDTSVSVDADENSLINNKVTVDAISGDATVEKNTQAGNATSGNAYAAVNIFNVIDSTINVNDWFGLLFINVFGTWNGSFGMDTASGNTPKAQTPKASNKTATATTFAFVPKPQAEAEGQAQQPAAQPAQQATYTEGAQRSGVGVALAAASEPGGTPPAAQAAGLSMPVMSDQWKKNLALSSVVAVLSVLFLYGGRAVDVAKTRFASFL